MVTNCSAMITMLLQHCIVIVQSSLYSHHCTVIIVQSSLYSHHCTVIIVQSSLYSHHCTVVIVQSSLFSHEHGGSINTNLSCSNNHEQTCCFIIAQEYCLSNNAVHNNAVPATLKQRVRFFTCVYVQWSNQYGRHRLQFPNKTRNSLIQTDKRTGHFQKTYPSKDSLWLPLSWR